jgi:hypothetical protein
LLAGVGLVEKADSPADDVFVSPVAARISSLPWPKTIVSEDGSSTGAS